MSRKVAIFEPWGLGDLAISLRLARDVARSGTKPVVFCDPAYVDWVRSHEFVDRAIGITVPWTKKSGKYAIREYPFREWNELKQSLRGEKFQEVVEPRRD